MDVMKLRLFVSHAVEELCHNAETNHVDDDCGSIQRSVHGTSLKVHRCAVIDLQSEPSHSLTVAASTISI